MKEKMDKESIDALIAYRLQRSDDTAKEFTSQLRKLINQ